MSINDRNVGLEAQANNTAGATTPTLTLALLPTRVPASATAGQMHPVAPAKRTSPPLVSQQPRRQAQP